MNGSYVSYSDTNIAIMPKKPILTRPQAYSTCKNDLLTVNFAIKHRICFISDITLCSRKIHLIKRQTSNYSRVRT